MTRRTIVLCFIGTLSSIGTLSAHRGRSARRRLGLDGAGFDVRAASARVPAFMKLRSSWERCIARYAAAASATPAHPFARTALQRQPS
jgi:hypothetical protein